MVALNRRLFRNHGFSSKYFISLFVNSSAHLLMIDVSSSLVFCMILSFNFWLEVEPLSFMLFTMITVPGASFWWKKRILNLGIS